MSLREAAPLVSVENPTQGSEAGRVEEAGNKAAHIHSLNEIFGKIASEDAEGGNQVLTALGMDSARVLPRISVNDTVVGALAEFGVVVGGLERMKRIRNLRIGGKRIRDQATDTLAAMQRFGAIGCSSVRSPEVCVVFCQRGRERERLKTRR